MDRADFWRDHQVADVVFDITHRHRGDHPLQAHPAPGVKIFLAPRKVRILALVRDQVVHQHYAHRPDARPDHFIDAVPITPRFAFLNHRVLRTSPQQAYSNFNARSKIADSNFTRKHGYDVMESFEVALVIGDDVCDSLYAHRGHQARVVNLYP